MSLFELPYDSTAAPYSTTAHRQLPILKEDSSVRAEHIRRLIDLLEISLQRNDSARAYRCWAILVRCYEVDLVATGWQSFARYFVSASSTSSQPGSSGTVQMLGTEALRERVLSGIAEGRIRETLEDLEV